MKKLFSIVAMLLVVASTQAQTFQELDSSSWILLSLTQDVKLATMEDDYGNSPFTTDATAKVKIRTFETNGVGAIEVQLGVEYADLSEQRYLRYSFGAAYNFMYMKLPMTDYRWQLVPFVNMGFISREPNSVLSPAIEFGSEFRFPISGQFKFISSMYFTDRNDTSKPLFKSYSWAAGVEVGLFNAK
jgi:hypothetical protein